MVYYCETLALANEVFELINEHFERLRAGLPSEDEATLDRIGKEINALESIRSAEAHAKYIEIIKLLRPQYH